MISTFFVDRITAVFFCLLTICSSSQSNAQTLWFVKQEGMGDGSAWSNALSSLQQAIDRATAGDTILVAKGTYLPEKQWQVVQDVEVFDQPRLSTFVLKEGITILGGFSGNENNPTSTETLANRDYVLNETILSGDLHGNDQFSVTSSGYEYTNYVENSYHVVSSINLTDSSILNGFTIQSGYANGGYAFESDNSQGAALYARAHSLGQNKLLLENMVFRNNYADLDGGALHGLAELGGLSILSITKSSFIHNSSGERGGAANLISVFGSQTIDISECIIDANSSKSGGGLYLGQGSNGPVNIVIRNSLIINNKATENGGGIFYSSFETSEPDYLEIINSTLARNQAQGNGGALYNTSFNSPQYIEIANSIFWSNMGNGRSWFNNYDQGSVGDFLLTASYSLLEESSIEELSQFGGIINLDSDNVLFNTDPLFVAEDDFQLSKDSPAIDQGSNVLWTSPYSTDLEGKARIENGIIDMGALEFHMEVVVALDEEKPDSFRIYPNPVSRVLNITTPHHQVQDIIILDLKGRVVLQKSTSEVRISIDLQDLTNATYILKLVGPFGVRSTFFMKQ